MEKKKTTKKTAAKKTVKKTAKKAPAKKIAKKAAPAKVTKKVVVKKVEPQKEVKPVVVDPNKGKPIGGLGKTAKVFFIFALVFGYITILPIPWILPMHISYAKHINKRIKISTGYKVCVLLFIGLVPGILMLCDDKN